MPKPKPALLGADHGLVPLALVVVEEVAELVVQRLA
jgi:hypothetical protein